MNAIKLHDVYEPSRPKVSKAVFITIQFILFLLSHAHGHSPLSPSFFSTHAHT